MKNNIDDNELISLLSEDETQVKDLLYEKYHYLIDIYVKKYFNVIKALQIDEQEVRGEALYGFSDGINAYNDHKEASLSTFLSLCIERRIKKYLSKFTTQKAQMLNEALSLDYNSNDSDLSLMDVIKSDKAIDPLNNITAFETFDEIVTLAKENLSDFEYIVFTYMINEVSYQEIAKILDKTPKQIDNTMQRIKIKMRKILEDIKFN